MLATRKAVGHEAHQSNKWKPYQSLPDVAGTRSVVDANPRESNDELCNGSMRHHSPPAIVMGPWAGLASANENQNAGGTHGPKDSDRGSWRRWRLYRRAYGAGRRGRDLHRSMARACRAHANAWPARHPREGRRGIPGPGASAA